MTEAERGGGVLMICATIGGVLVEIKVASGITGLPERQLRRNCIVFFAV